MKLPRGFAVFLAAAAWLLGACGALAESKHEKAARVLGIEANDNGDYDSSDLNHLVFLHEHATAGDKALAAGFLETAHDRMLASPSSFPIVAYFEALLAYPTAATLLGTANGFLRMAKLAEKAAEPSTQSQAEGHFKKALLYYGLTTEFAAATGQRLHPKQHEDILYDIGQTETCIERRSSAGRGPVCQEVLDVSLPPTLIEMKNRASQ